MIKFYVYSRAITLPLIISSLAFSTACTKKEDKKSEAQAPAASTPATPAAPATPAPEAKTGDGKTATTPETDGKSPAAPTAPVIPVAPAAPAAPAAPVTPSPAAQPSVGSEAPKQESLPVLDPSKPNQPTYKSKNRKDAGAGDGENPGSELEKAQKEAQKGVNENLNEKAAKAEKKEDKRTPEEKAKWDALCEYAAGKGEAYDSGMGVYVSIIDATNPDRFSNRLLNGFSVVGGFMQNGKFGFARVEVISETWTVTKDDLMDADLWQFLVSKTGVLAKAYHYHMVKDKHDLVSVHENLNPSEAEGQAKWDSLVKEWFARYDEMKKKDDAEAEAASGTEDKPAPAPAPAASATPETAQGPSAAPAKPAEPAVQTAPEAPQKTPGAAIKVNKAKKPRA